MSQWIPLPAHLRTLAAQSPNAVLLETSRFDPKNRHSFLFLDPEEIFQANKASELDVVFDWIESSRRRGLHLAGYLSYECGYLLEEKLNQAAFATSISQDALPLAWFGAYQSPFVFDHAQGKFLGPIPPGAPFPETLERFASAVKLEIVPGEYVQKIQAIKHYIEAGDTYQVNFTDSVTVENPHDPAVAFAVLSGAQPVAYSALLHVGGQHILSLSPELFFRIRDGRITTRPMKGTIPRGLDLQEDDRHARRLQSDEKNRSEHIMIVDLLRNDLGRICRMGSVQVEDLFSVERYRTLLQMTSTISGELNPDLSFGEIFRAIFPSGSITGAPKLRTMQIIRELERQPRGVYTGAIGHIPPSGDATFNVAIRTLVLRDGTATMGVGGGIVADSDPASEYRECQLKTQFLTRPVRQFQLIETMLFDGHSLSLLALHLDRLVSSAAYFDFACDRDAIESRLCKLEASLVPGQRQRVRLLLDETGALTLTHSEFIPDPAPLIVRISPCRTRSDDPLLRHKTTLRELYDQEYAQARADGFDEVIFLNERDELTEGAISTLFVEQGGHLLTPPLSAGVLPGVLRRHILATRPEAREATVPLAGLATARAVYVGNSLRGLRPIAEIHLPGRLPLRFNPVT
ncbi:aminodeoxychorismate synthase component I [Edaphobacter sp. 12200R-103]|uniref:aminodeoxychorismate synthase component I n=1 Tax=Edaphobacter sp. 12200R-103 TaxID=2703788 RepID=UPI00138D748A|nr:aminodeoxychorismate synthase component I [Edaphobacter sp. 12200R-103]QHS52406.1 aminodeoxychorismate synthase component I [Edaphobacter sp. 12200R-103]